MYNAAQPASNGGTRIQLIGDVEYRADRIILDDKSGSGWIEIRGFIDGQRLVRALYDAATGERSLQTFAGPAPQVAVEWLFAEVESALA